MFAFINAPVRTKVIAHVLLYLLGYELLSLHVLLLLLLLLFQDLLLFQRRRHLAVHVRRIPVVTCHGVGPWLGRHGIVSRRRCHGDSRTWAVWRSRIGVLVLRRHRRCSQGAALPRHSASLLQEPKHSVENGILVKKQPMR